jgi:mono/diheme cytochrome c family protein
MHGANSAALKEANHQAIPNGRKEMKGFIWGFIAAVVSAVLVALFVGLTGRISMRADILPTSLEQNIAMRVMDANVERNAPKIANPVQPTDQNIVAGASIYREHCALCHGDPSQPKSPVADTLYPPPPQFVTDPVDMEEHENYYIILHGVRWTGMPGWKNVLQDQEIWQVVTFLSHMNKLPPAAKAVFGVAGGSPTAAPAKPMKMKM